MRCVRLVVRTLSVVVLVHGGLTAYASAPPLPAGTEAVMTTGAQQAVVGAPDTPAAPEGDWVRLLGPATPGTTVGAIAPAPDWLTDGLMLVVRGSQLLR